MPESTDYYALLGVAPSASHQEIAAAYRRLARAYHPDVNQRPDATDRMRRINTAYGVLSDARKRAVYDGRLRAGSGWHSVASAAPPSARADWRSPTASASAPRPGSTATASHHTTRVIGLGFVGLALAFATLTCVLTAQVPTTTRPDGMVVLPHATATALALAAQPATQPSGAPSQSEPINLVPSVATALRENPALRKFPGPVLVPPATLAPFAALAAQPPSISGTGCDGSLVCEPRYVISYGQSTAASAEIAGFGGRDVFESDVSAAGTCTSTGAVCLAPISVGRPEVQYVRDLQLTPGVAALARHQNCCPGPYWVLTWYDATSNTTYRLQLSGGATVLGPDASAPDLAADGATLLGIATGLVRLR